MLFQLQFQSLKSKLQELSRQSLLLLFFIVVNLVACPVCMYYVFEDLEFLEFSSFPQICQTIISGILFSAGVVTYLYLTTWLKCLCYPATAEMMMENECYLLGPIAACTWISLIQLKWTIFVTVFILAYFLGGLLANIIIMEFESMRSEVSKEMCDSAETVTLIPNPDDGDVKTATLNPADPADAAVSSGDSDEETVLYERGNCIIINC